MTDDFRKEFEGREGSLGDLASRLIRVGAEAVSVSADKIREKGEDLRARELVSGAASLTARGKDEVVTLIANEVRNYLDKLRVGEELRSLITEHSLEVQASFRVKPVEERAEAKPEAAKTKTRSSRGKATGKAAGKTTRKPRRKSTPRKTED